MRNFLKKSAGNAAAWIAAIILLIGVFPSVADASGSMETVPENERTNSTTRIDAVRPDAPELAARGEFDTGVRTLELTNPDQLNVTAVLDGEEGARYDRPLTVEFWYPADIAQEESLDAGRYEVNARDGSQASLRGSSVRDADPDRQGAAYPLVILSHGYPGNRYLMSHFGEFLASHGYVVASIDHTDSTYTDQGAFASTLRNRSLDQLFVLDELDRLSDGESEFLEGLVDAERTGIIGYSMGGYGLLNTVGAGLSDSAPDTLSVPEDVLENRLASSEEYPTTLDSRVKAAVAIAPWGLQLGLWNEEALSNVETPVFFMSGSVDDVSGYEDGPRVAFNEMSGTERFFLTFENANHNAAAPVPAPREVFESGEGYDHYSDAVWDNVRMNNIAQHYVAAFLGRELRDDSNMDRYLVGGEFEGFPDRTTAGLRFEYLGAGE